MRGAVRLAALMKLPVTYVWTHDSIGLGEDGPTHQPVEHLAALRAIPGLDVVRPADANETAAAWRRDPRAHRPAGRPGPDPAERADLPARHRRLRRPTEDVAKGGYVLLDADGRRARGDPDRHRLRGAARRRGRASALADEGIPTRVVSMPCREWFDEQDAVLPRDRCSRRPSRPGSRVEAGIALGWHELVGDAGRSVVDRALRRVAPTTRRCTSEFGFTAEARRRTPPRTASAPLGQHRLTHVTRQPRRSTMTDHLQQLSDAGVSIWLDDLSRERLRPATSPSCRRTARRRRDHQPDDLRQGARRRRALRRAGARARR